MTERRTIPVIEERRVHERVSELEQFMRVHTVEHTHLLNTFAAGMDKMATAVSEMAGVIKIYNQGKGALETVKDISKVIFWLASIIVSSSAIIAAVQFWRNN